MTAPLDRFCRSCGAAAEHKTPKDDNRMRAVCTACAQVHYTNPTTVVGTVLWYTKASQNTLLLCRRAIEPRHGFWTIPAGFLEQSESLEQGALRETQEEAGVTDVSLTGLLAIYSLAHISQTQIFFHGKLNSPQLDPGPESLEAKLFEINEIPWKDLAFPTTDWAIRHAIKIADTPYLQPADIRTQSL